VVSTQNKEKLCGRQADEKAPAERRWQAYRVLKFAGATFTMPHIPENETAYPQQSSQQPGCGFPLACIVVVFSQALCLKR
jgi:hypothetical protein